VCECVCVCECVYECMCVYNVREFLSPRALVLTLLSELKLSSNSESIQTVATFFPAYSTPTPAWPLERRISLITTKQTLLLAKGLSHLMTVNTHLWHNAGERNADPGESQDQISA
jgi:hypothetical protein